MDVNEAQIARLLIGNGRNLGNCIRTATSAGKATPLMDDGGHRCNSLQLISVLMFHGAIRSRYPSLTTFCLYRLAALPFRDVRGRDNKCVTQYVEAKDKYLSNHNFYNRIQQLKDLTIEDPALTERLDQDWHCASLSGGKQARKVHKTWLSSTLAKAKQHVNLLRTLLSMLQQKRNYRIQIGHLRA
jgi:hypothetical protein